MGHHIKLLLSSHIKYLKQDTLFFIKKGVEFEVKKRAVYVGIIKNWLRLDFFMAISG